MCHRYLQSHTNHSIKDRCFENQLQSDQNQLAKEAKGLMQMSIQTKIKNKKKEPDFLLAL